MTSGELETRLLDRRWRLNNLYRIKDKHGRDIPFKMNDAQGRLLDNMHYLCVILKARQLGFSTFIAIFILDMLLFNGGLSAGLIDKTMTDAKDKLAKMKYAYERMPDELRERISQGDTWSTEELTWSNGSSAVAGVSLRGGTYQLLHVSEFGKIAFKDQKRAKEIRTGAFNTIALGQFIFVESTHEGGKGGDFYDMCKIAMENQGKNLTEMDFKFFFEPWYSDSAYVMGHEGVEIPDTMTAYFDEIEVEAEVSLSPGQRAWYVKKQQQQGDDMKKEFPSTPEEAFEVVVEGAIYGDKISAARAQGRIVDFAYDPELPVFTFWDLGFSDTTAIWALQFVGREIHIIDHFEDNGQPCHYYAKQLTRWEDDKGYNIRGHFLPHDADKKELGSGKTVREQLEDAGLKRITVVPRTPDRWVGINHMRALWNRVYVHRTNCKRGIECLEAYRKPWNENLGRFMDEPLHDWASNSADALRTFSEAHDRGMLKDNSLTGKESRRGAGASRVLTGMRGSQRKLARR